MLLLDELMNYMVIESDLLAMSPSECREILVLGSVNAVVLFWLI